MKRIAVLAVMTALLLLIASGPAQASIGIVLTMDQTEYEVGETVEITMTNAGNEVEPVYEGKSIINLDTGELVYIFHSWCGTPIGFMDPGESVLWTWDQKIDVVYWTLEGWFEDPKNGQQVEPGRYEASYMESKVRFTIGDVSQPGYSYWHSYEDGYGPEWMHWAAPSNGNGHGELPEFYMYVEVQQDEYPQGERVYFDIYFLDYANIGMRTIQFDITRYDSGVKLDTPTYRQTLIKDGFPSPAAPYDNVVTMWWDPIYWDGTLVEPGHYEVNVDVWYVAHTTDYGEVVNQGHASDDFYLE